MKLVRIKIYVLAAVALIAAGCAVAPALRDANARDRAIDACGGSLTCYATVISNAIDTKGLDAGFTLLNAIDASQPAFRPQCSTFAMELSKSIYADHPDFNAFSFTPAIETCNYAFLQQYPTELVIATKNVDAAQQLCEKVSADIGERVPAAESECWRGIGKGLPFISGAQPGDQAAMAAFAVKKCREMAPNESDYDTCVSGLFNYLGRSSVLGAYGLTLVTNDPMRLCEIQTDPDVRGRCFGNYKATVISMVNVNDPQQARQEILRLYGASASSSADDAIWTIGYEWATAKLVKSEDIESTLAACASLPGPAASQCVQGVSVGIAKNGIPSKQYVLLSEFCRAARAQIPVLAVSDCPSAQAVGYLRGFFDPLTFVQAEAFMHTMLGQIARPPTDTYGY